MAADVSSRMDKNEEMILRARWYDELGARSGFLLLQHTRRRDLVLLELGHFFFLKNMCPSYRGRSRPLIDVRCSHGQLQISIFELLKWMSYPCSIMSGGIALIVKKMVSHHVPVLCGGGVQQTSWILFATGKRNPNLLPSKLVRVSERTRVFVFHPQSELYQSELSQ